MRRKLFYWLCKIVKHKQGDLLPWYLLIFKSVLMPLDFYNCTGIKYDFFRDTLIIDGIKYSRQFFHDWSKQGIPDGQFFRIDKRENRTIYLSTFGHVEPSKPWPRR